MTTAKPSGLLLPFAFCLLSLALSSCGYVGEPLPPALNIPRRVADLGARQHADRIVFEFTVPELTTEGLPIKLGSIELRVAAADDPFNEDAWRRRSELLEPDCAGSGPCRVKLPAQPWVGRKLAARVRLLNPNGRAGDWSDFAVLRVIQPLQPPSALRAEAVSSGVRLAWQVPDPRADIEFHIRRRAGGEDSFAVIATVREREWVDAQTHYGTRYEYSVQAAVKSDASEALSEISGAASVTPEDRFAPAPPAGLIALAGVDSVELAWDRNTEADLAGYFVHRASGDQPYQKIAGPLAAPSYSDRNVERGTSYRYAVSSVDRLENESERSQPVEITLP